MPRALSQSERRYVVTVLRRERRPHLVAFVALTACWLFLNAIGPVAMWTEGTHDWPLFLGVGLFVNAVLVPLLLFLRRRVRRIRVGHEVETITGELRQEYCGQLELTTAVEF